MGAVQNAMQRDGLDPTIMDLDHDKSVASQLKKEEEDDGPPLREDPKYQKYFKMLKMVSPFVYILVYLWNRLMLYDSVIIKGLPVGAVKNAMQRDGLDPAIMDLNPEKSVASQQNKEEEELVDKGPPLKEDPRFQKYFKVCQFLPASAFLLFLSHSFLSHPLLLQDVKNGKMQSRTWFLIGARKLTIRFLFGH